MQVSEKAKWGYVRIAVLFFNTFLLFLFINLIFVFIPDPASKKLAYYRTLYLSPVNALKKNMDVLSKVYPGKSKEEIISRVEKAPNVKSHPVLEYMDIPVQNNCYYLGIENIRYDLQPFDDSLYKARLNGSVWVFGGSTVFGRGVCSDETITWYLHANDSQNTYLNMGCQGYNQNNETDKLVLLLKKGYRPHSVIFIDGLNDLTTLSMFGFEAAETPSGTNAPYATEFGINQELFSKNSLYFIPVVKWYNQYKASQMAGAGLPVEENIYSPHSRYNQFPYLHYQSFRENIHQPDSLLAKKMFSFYQGNLQLIRQLATAYQFTAHVFFQPLGILFQNNPFIVNKEVFRKRFFHVQQLAYLQKKMCSEIKKGQFYGFTDISYLDRQCALPPYVDLTHYSAAMNELMAKTILNTIKSQ